MRIANVTVLVLVLFGSAAIAAPEASPSLGQPDMSSPAVAAFVAWNTALLKADYTTYRRLTPAMPSLNADQQRQLFDQFRSTAPQSVKVTTPKTNAKGGVEFQAAGCIGTRPVVSLVAVGNQSGTWLVCSSGWGPSWNPKISELVKCP